MRRLGAELPLRALGGVSGADFSDRQGNVLWHSAADRAPGLVRGLRAECPLSRIQMGAGDKGEAIGPLSHTPA